MCPKDKWIIDCINNFLCKEDLNNSIIKKLSNMETSMKRMALLTRMSINEKNRIIRIHEDNLKKRTAY